MKKNTDPISTSYVDIMEKITWKSPGMIIPVMTATCLSPMRD